MNSFVARGLAALALLGLLAGCAKKETPTLHVYTWADYIKPELLQRFLRATARGWAYANKNREKVAS